MTHIEREITKFQFSSFSAFSNYCPVSDIKSISLAELLLYNYTIVYNYTIAYNYTIVIQIKLLLLTKSSAQNHLGNRLDPPTNTHTHHTKRACPNKGCVIEKEASQNWESCPWCLRARLSHHLQCHSTARTNKCQDGHQSRIHVVFFSTC